MKILITGGAGYIGSHSLVEVIKAGHEARVVDSLVMAMQQRLRGWVS